MTNQKIRRRKLLPWWMKFFIWIFMFATAIGIVAIFLETIGKPINLTLGGERSIYGMTTHNSFSLLGIFINLLMIFKGITAFGMWTEKDWGIKFGIIDASVGIIICIITMFTQPLFELENGTWNFNFGLEIVFLIPYLIKCLRIRKSWENAIKLPSFDTTSNKEDIHSNENLNIEKEDKIDKEDPTRFMPK